jgi:hypothetical protein
MQLRHSAYGSPCGRPAIRKTDKEGIWEKVQPAARKGSAHSFLIGYRPAVCYNLINGGIMGRCADTPSARQPVSGGYWNTVVSSEEVNKVEVLCGSDREMMLEFSRLCINRLRNHLPLRLFFTLFEGFFEANVLKEIEKNRLIIEHAAVWFGKGRDRSEIDVDGLFEITKEIDSEFVRKASSPLISMDIRYEDFAEIRKKRIVSLIRMIYALLQYWQDGVPFSGIVKGAFAENSYRETLGEVLHLYNTETRLLSNSIAVHGPAGRLKTFFANQLMAVMEKTSWDIVDGYARAIYEGQGLSSPDPGPE